MTKFNLNVDPEHRRNMTRANAAFSKVEYPSAIEVFDVLVRHKLASLFAESAELVTSGVITLSGLFLNLLESDDDYLVLLNGSEIHGIVWRIWEEQGNWPGTDGRRAEALAIVKDVLSSLGLLTPLEKIGITVTVIAGRNPEDDAIIFEAI